MCSKFRDRQRRVQSTYCDTLELSNFQIQLTNSGPAGHQVRPEPRDHPGRGEEGQAGRDRARRGPGGDHLLAAGAVPQEGRAVLHRQVQVPPGQVRAQEDRLLPGADLRTLFD